VLHGDNAEVRYAGSNCTSLESISEFCLAFVPERGCGATRIISVFKATSSAQNRLPHSKAKSFSGCLVESARGLFGPETDCGWVTEASGKLARSVMARSFFA